MDLTSALLRNLIGRERHLCDVHTYARGRLAERVTAFSMLSEFESERPTPSSLGSCQQCRGKSPFGKLGTCLSSGERNGLGEGQPSPGVFLFFNNNKENYRVGSTTSNSTLGVRNRPTLIWLVGPRLCKWVAQWKGLQVSVSAVGSSPTIEDFLIPRQLGVSRQNCFCLFIGVSRFDHIQLIRAVVEDELTHRQFVPLRVDPGGCLGLLLFFAYQLPIWIYSLSEINVVLVLNIRS